MVAVPAEIMEKLKSPGATKILVTASKEGQPHAIVCGSIIFPAEDKVAVGEILMKRAAKYLEENGKAAILAAEGPVSYELVLKNPQRVAEGPALDEMNANLAKANLKARALWIFDVAEVYDEGAGPNAGNKVA